MIVRRCDAVDEGWLRLRDLLWEQPHDVHRSEMASQVARPERFAVFLAHEGGAIVGFAEAALRHDYVNGCSTSPVVFLEGIYVDEPYRRRGIARSLCNAVADWGRAAGCTEFASDAYADDTRSHAMHRALGFEELETVTYFRRGL
jgi:aminoglycoside 6'-N-acetyltransferase I